jgi:repressor LexA
VIFTVKQSRSLAFLRTYHAEHGYPATVRELCSAMGWHSTKAAADMLDALERKGAVTRERGKARSLRVTRGG